MATYDKTATSAWAEVTEAGTSTDFILQPLESVPMIARFAATEPAAAATGHYLVGDPLIRAGVDGKLWVRTAGAGMTCDYVISVGA